MIRIDDQIACVERELRLRRQVYPRLVAQGRMTEAACRTEVATMEAVLETLEAKAAEARLL